MTPAGSAHFGAALRTTRTTLGLSQLGLAGVLGSTQRHISFLETGRSLPTLSFLTRLSRELQLSTAQRAGLYEASGFSNPYKRREFQSDEIRATLDMLDARVLAHWPFPAMVLDPTWNILRQNAPASRLFSMFDALDANNPNLMSVMLSETFRNLIVNWEACAPILFYRLQASALKDPTLRSVLDQALEQGLFDDLPGILRNQDDVPVFVPVALALPGDITLELTSFLGQLASVQDAIVEGFEIEFMVPTTQASEDAMLALLT